jgi:hypothetical protein
VGYSKCLPRLRGELSSNIIDLAKGAHEELLLEDAIYYEELSQGKEEGFRGIEA